MPHTIKRVSCFAKLNCGQEQTLFHSDKFAGYVVSLKVHCTVSGYGRGSPPHFVGWGLSLVASAINKISPRQTSQINSGKQTSHSSVNIILT